MPSIGFKGKCVDVNNTEDFQWCITNQVDFITTNEPITLQNVLKTNNCYLFVLY